MEKPTYVVIDMHKDTFHRGRPDRYPIVRAVAAVIDEAMANECPIIFVKFHDSAELVQELWDRTDGYLNRVLVTKYNFDGSLQIERTCNELRFATAHFRLCGVAADVCVRSTAAGLCERFPDSRVQVLTYACDDPEAGWGRYRKGWAARVQLVGAPPSAKAG